jgi:hypothetical protein
MTCGQPANYGVGVKMRTDSGNWYCRAHYEMTPEGQEQVARNMREAMEGEADAD